LAEGVNIVAERARKQNWVLWNDPELGAKVVEAHATNVNVGDVNAPAGGFHDSEETGDQTGLPCPRPSHNPNLPQNKTRT